MDGIKYTACRIMAEKATDRILEKLDRTTPCKTAETLLVGGDYETRSILEAEIKAVIPKEWGPETVKLIAESYGSDWHKVWKGSSSAALLPDERTPEYFITHAIEKEMALHLGDVMLRRCPLGTFGYPSEQLVDRVASLMATHLKWSPETKEAEKQSFKNLYDYS
jgi:glycerol-3-phosphate dehydrogenase